MPLDGAVRAGFDTTAVVKVDRAAQKLQTTGGKTLTFAEVMTAHPGIVEGMIIVRDGQQVIVLPTKKPGVFELAPANGDVKLKDKLPKITAAELSAQHPHAVEHMLGPPAVRLVTHETRPVTVDGKTINETVAVELHGYQLLGVDHRSKTALVRDPDGHTRQVHMHELVYEHGGGHPGTMPAWAEVRYQDKLLALGDKALGAWGQVHARAADISNEHATLAKMLFLRPGADAKAVDAFIERIKDVPAHEVGALFSMMGMTQHWADSCVATCSLWMMATSP